MKDVLVTGGAGFIGSNLVRELLWRNCDVTVLDDFSTGNRVNLFATVIEHDISQPLPELPAFDTCFHLAAVSRIGMSFEDRGRCYDVNVVGTDNIGQLCLQNKAKLVFTSTSCCSGDVSINPYAHTKYNAEQEVKVFGGVIARLFNVYGPGEPEEGPASTVVAKYVRARRNNEPIVIHGTGEQRRDFVHVEDVVNALIVLAERGEAGQPYDVGTGVNYSINELAAMFGTCVTYETLPPGQLQETLADNERLRTLRWVPTHNLKAYVNSVLSFPKST